MSRHFRIATPAGFTLLPVVLAMSLIAAIAFLLNRDNGINANLIGAQSDRERALYAAEAGLQAVNYKIQAIGCAGGYPILSTAITDSDFGDATFSAFADRTTGWPLKLKSTGTYNGAVATLERSNVAVYGPPASTTLQAPDDGTGTDASLNWTNPSSNYGESISLKVQSATYSGLIQFNIDSIPNGSRIISATLRLNKSNSSSPTGTMVVYRVTTPWVEGTQTGAVSTTGVNYNTSNGITPWTTPGGDYYPAPVASLINSVQDWNSWNVTTLMQGWSAGSYPNYGMIVVPTTSGVFANFDSSDNSDEQNHPKLLVTYTPPCT